jgi:dienelactone hydrolase
MRINFMKIILSAYLLVAGGILWTLAAAQTEIQTTEIPQTDVRGSAEMTTVSVWRICGPFALSKGQTYLWYSNTSEANALALDYLKQIGGSESPLLLRAPTTRVTVDFSVDVKNQVKGVDDSSPTYQPFIDQIQSFPSGSVSSQVLYYGFPKRFAITYAAAHLRSVRRRTVVFVVGSNSPLKIWLNGNVIVNPSPGSAGHNWSDYAIVRARLRAGTNSLLVKMFSFPERNDFSFHVGTATQAERFLSENATYLDLLDKITMTRDTPLLLTRNFEYLASHPSNYVRVSISDSFGNEIRTAKIDLKQTREVRTQGIQDGLYDLKVNIGRKAYAETFYIGDINYRLTEYKAFCDKHKDNPPAIDPCLILSALQERMSDPQMTTRLDKEKPLVLLLSQFEWILRGIRADTPVQANGRHVFLESYRSDLDGALQHYYIHLPPDYYRHRSVPLVIVCPYDDHHKDFLLAPTNTLAPVLQEYAFWADRFGFAFIVTYARGVGMSNPEGLKDVLEALRDSQKKYRIDPYRLYLTGDCAGGRGALLLAEHAPLRFAAVSTLNAATNTQYVSYGDDEDDNDEYIDDGLFARIGSLSKLPILLVHGDLYPHSPISRAFKFKARCVQNGFDPELVSLPGEGTLGLHDPVYLSFSFFKGKCLQAKKSDEVAP